MCNHVVAMPSVRREVVLPVEPERAWELITDPEELEGWLADDVELDPEEGGEVRVEWEDGERREGIVEGVAAGRRIVFTWGEEPSRVVWTLDPVPEGTRFVVTERTLAPVVGPRMAALASRASLCLACASPISARCSQRWPIPRAGRSCARSSASAPSPRPGSPRSSP